MGKKKTNVTFNTLVQTTVGHRKIALEHMGTGDHRGGVIFMRVNDGGDHSSSFYFENAEEAALFVSRCLAELEGYLRD